MQRHQEAKYHGNADGHRGGTLGRWGHAYSLPGAVRDVKGETQSCIGDPTFLLGDETALEPRLPTIERNNFKPPVSAQNASWRRKQENQTLWKGVWTGSGCASQVGQGHQQRPGDSKGHKGS